MMHWTVLRAGLRRLRAQRREAPAYQQVRLHDEHCTSGLHNGATSSMRSSSSTTSAPMMCLHAIKSTKSRRKAPNENTARCAGICRAAHVNLKGLNISRAGESKWNAVSHAGLIIIMGQAALTASGDTKQQWN